MKERQQIDSQHISIIGQLFRLMYLEKMTKRHSSLQQLQEMYSQWQDQSICMVGTFNSASRLDTKDSEYYLIHMKNAIMGDLQIAIESTEYLVRFGPKMNILIGRDNQSYYCLDSLSFCVIDTKPYYKIRNSSTLKQIEKSIYQKWIVPLMVQFYDEKPMSFDWSQYQPHESKAIPSIKLFDVRKKVEAFYEQKKVLIGVVEIVQKRVKINTGTKRTTFKVLLHERFSRSDSISYKNYRIQIQYIHGGDVPEEPVVNWGCYAFFNPMLGRSHKTNPVFLIETNVHNNCKVVRLENTVFPMFVERYVKSQMVTASLMDIEQTILSRECFKVSVFMTGLEIMMAKWVCSRCYQKINEERCEKCDQSGEISLWLLVFVQDGGRCAYLQLKTREAIQFLRLKNQHLEALGKAARESPNNYVFIYDKSRPIRGLSSVQRLLCFTSNEKTMLVTPTIDINKTVKSGLTPQQRAENEIGFQPNRAIQDRMTVNPNGTFFGQTPILCLKCLKIL